MPAEAHQGTKGERDKVERALKKKLLRRK